MPDQPSSAANQPLPRANGAARGLAILRRLEVILVATLLVVIVGCVLWGITTRYVSPRPSPWTIEVASIAFCWCCLVGAGAFYARGIHPRIFDPSHFFLHRLRPFASSLSRVVEATVLILVGYYGGVEVITHLDNPTSILRLPVSIYYAPLLWFSLSGLLALTLRG